MPVRGHSWDYWQKKLMKEQDYDEETANKIIGSWEQEDKKKSTGEADPCWDNYEQYGMKGDPPVPNCVPKKTKSESFDPKELEMGKKVELEHTDDEDEAEKIAKDHLKEVPDYYTKLAKYVENGQEAIEFEGETYISLGENEKADDNDLEYEGKIYKKETSLNTTDDQDDSKSLSTKSRGRYEEGMIDKIEDLADRFGINLDKDPDQIHDEESHANEEGSNERKRIADWYGNTGTQKEDGSVVDDKDLIKSLEESHANEEGMATVSGPADSSAFVGTGKKREEAFVLPEGKHIDDTQEALADTNVGGDLGKELGDSVVESHDPILLNGNYLAFENVLYRPVYAGENIDINDDSILIYENKYYTSEGTGNCPMCKGAGKVTVERLGLKECPKCDGSGDIQEQPQMQQPDIPQEQLQESKSNEEFREEDRNRDSDGKWVSKGGGSSNKKTTQFYNPIDELGSTVMDQIESGDKNGVLRQWIKDQSDNKEQKSKIDMVKKELNKRGISTESYASESLTQEQKKILSDWVKENPDWTSIDDLPDDMSHWYLQHDDSDTRTDIMLEVLDLMEKYKTKSNESCGCKVKAFESSVNSYKQFINKEIQVLKKRAKAGEAVGLMYGLPTVRKNGRKIKGTLAYAGVSLNDRIYLPEELAKGHGKTLPLLLNHSSTAGAEEELDRLDNEMLHCLENEIDYQVGEVTLTWDPQKLTLFYEGVVENEFFQKEIDDMNMAVSLGIYYDSDSPKVCDEECYTLIKGAEFREVSLVYHAGFPIATIEAVEAELKRKSKLSIAKEEMDKTLPDGSIDTSPSDNNYIPPPAEFDSEESIAEEEEDPLPKGGSIDAEPKPPMDKPVFVESFYSPNSFSIRGVSGMTISNSNGVERYSFDPTQNYSTNTVHFSVVGEGATIFGEQLQPKMATSDDLTKEIESKPDIEVKDSDEDFLKKN